MNELFSEHTREPLLDVTCKRYQELEQLSWYHILDQVDWGPELNGISSHRLRHWLETTFRSLDPKEQTEILKRSKKSRDPDLNHGVFFELILFRLFLELGLSVEVHPPVLGVKTHPDFLVHDRDKSCYIEAIVTGQSPFYLNPNEKKVVHLLNENLSSSDFQIGIRVEGELKATLGIKKVVPPFRNLLNEHAFDEVLHLYDKSGMHCTPSHTIVSGEWKLTGWLCPAKVSNFEVARTRSTIIYPYETKSTTDSVTGMVKRIRSKSQKYGHLNHPLIVAVAPRNMYLSDIELQRDLVYGNMIIPNADVRTRVDVRRSRRFWFSAGRMFREGGIIQRCQRATGVLLCEPIDVWNLGQSRARLYVNPCKGRVSELPGFLFNFPHDLCTKNSDGRWFVDSKSGNPLYEMLSLF